MIYQEGAPESWKGTLVAVDPTHKVYGQEQGPDGSLVQVEMTETRRNVQTRETEAKQVLTDALVSAIQALPAGPTKTAMANASASEKTIFRDTLYAQLAAGDLIKQGT